MACEECGADGAEPVRVEYVEAGAETLRLCADCREQFADGDLVADVTAESARDGTDRES